MINFSLFSEASWFSPEEKKKKSEPITSVHGDVTGLAWRPDWWERGGPGGGDRPCTFIVASVRRVKDTKQAWDASTGSWTAPLHFTGHSEVRGPTPPPCQMMNPAQGSPSEDGKQLHQKEETETEEEEAQPKDMTTEKGYKNQRSSLPFSVESLISKKTTCRSAFAPSEFSLVLPKPVAEHFSPRTLYAERKLSTESSPGVSSCSSEENPQFCDKDQSTWFQTASFPTPPRKLLPLFSWKLRNLGNNRAHFCIFHRDEHNCRNEQVCSCQMYLLCACVGLIILCKVCCAQKAHKTHKTSSFLRNLCDPSANARNFRLHLCSYFGSCLVSLFLIFFPL